MNLVHEKFTETEYRKFNRVSDETQMFVSYVWSFYNHVDGVYPIEGLTKDMVVDATHKYIADLRDDITWGGGDSLDRERVRDIILEDNDLGHDCFFTRF